MKKMKKILCICFALFTLVLPFVFTGCETGSESRNNETSPYIEVSGIATNYVVGDEFDFSNAKIIYHKADGTTENISITNSMVTSQGTENAGSFNMVFSYEGMFVQKKYEVYDIDRLIQDVTTKTKNQNSIKATMVSLDEYTLSEYAMYDKDGTYLYSKRVDNSYAEDWTFSDKYYYHMYESAGIYAGDSTSSGDNDGIVGFDDFLGEYFNCFNEENGLKNISLLADGIYELSYYSADEEVYVVISDNLIISAVHAVRDSSKVYSAYVITYNSDEIPELPDLDWE